MEQHINIESISQLHELLGYEKPTHPLITLIDLTKISPIISTHHLHIVTDFYTISLKEGSGCKNKYGREYYDFQEGSLTFMAPKQALYVSENNLEVKSTFGWLLCFHPDLICNSSLSNKMNHFSFFHYHINEALHLSDLEKSKITGIVNDIQTEFSQNLDAFSQSVIISYLELLLNHCKRFYGRQFITREKVGKDVITQFEGSLRHYFDSENPKTLGLPTVKYFAQRMGYSPNYLSDLIKKETGINAQEHIHIYIIEKAKDMLSHTEKSMGQISAQLGFEYPQHFSKLFKNRTGMSPTAYRN